MSYRALYRVWRPQQFRDIVGQEHVTTTLQNALSMGQLAHAYLFHGPRGTGKTSAAKILAKAVNCDQGPAAEPCNQCDACQKITAGQMIDVVEIDAASNRGVDDIRELRDQVRYAPTEARYKVYMIDEAHMLTLEAFNALLKTLEEPPAHVLFILATTEPHKLLPTILSRCQRFSFRRITFEQIVTTLEKICQVEKVTYDVAALRLLARSADGGLRDALSLLDQALAFADRQLDEQAVIAVTGSSSMLGVTKLLQLVQQQHVAQALVQLQQLVLEGAEATKVLDDLIYICRDLLLMKTSPQLERLQGKLEEESELNRLQELWSQADLLSMLEVMVAYQQRLNQVTQPYLLLEMVLIRLCQGSQSSEVKHSTEHEEVDNIKRELRQLRRQLEALTQGDHKQREVVLQPQSQPVEANKSHIPKRLPQLTQLPSTSSPSSHRSSPVILQRVRAEWSKILRCVKERKITIHAWLVNGELKAANEAEIYLVFSSKIHRDTVVRDNNRSFIEEIFLEILGHPFKLETIMADEWQDTEEQVATVIDAAEPPAPLAVTKAREIFGQNLIEWV